MSFKKLAKALLGAVIVATSFCVGISIASAGSVTPQAAFAGR